MLEVEDHCVHVQTLEQAFDELRLALEGRDLVGELLAERRREAERENAEMAAWTAEAQLPETAAAPSSPDAA